MSNKRKIINDPVHGFITIPDELIFDLIQHPYFQRLRRIKQLGLSHLVYPGANHTRFHHALGAMHLMRRAIDVLTRKGIKISQEEKQAASIAVLLHDIGHGPFSHTLENSLLKKVHHEEMSLLFMNKLNEEYKGKLTLAISIFLNTYKKSFLHDLVSSQLDMDRLDYLQRDSFFTGVSEGVVGSDRIIAMLNVVNDQLVVEEKGIYSIENFISARRIMYWQVYMHKTVVSSEFMLIKILKRAKELFQTGRVLFTSPFLKIFLEKEITFTDFESDENLLKQFALIDDNDLICSIKAWQFDEDKILSTLCSALISRKLFRTEISKTVISKTRIAEKQQQIELKMGLSSEEAQYFIQENKLINSAYDVKSKPILILSKDGRIQDLAKASDNLNISTLSKPVEKHCFSYLNL
jgi:HD superfamily phosphohydrolase